MILIASNFKFDELLIYSLTIIKKTTIKIIPMNLEQDDWRDQLNKDANAVILDVRTEDEFSEGIIPGAINIDIYKGQGFIYAIEELDKSKSYYVYCRSGGRSGQACSIMSQLGFEKAYNLLGGIMNWEGEVV
jgi:rhodanese-related sulfurtransferase